MAYIQQPIHAHIVNTPFTTVQQPSDDELDIYIYEEYASYPASADPMGKRMFFVLAFVVAVVSLFIWLKPSVESVEQGMEVGSGAGVANEPNVNSLAPAPVIVENAGISPVFTAEVDYWGPKIVEWAAQYQLDPNLVATIMQIESCGDPQAVSSAGAQGLFQVMPFHFTAGEDMLDPNTNANRGVNYYAERLKQTNGDVGRAFAGYNGGHVAAAANWSDWANETQRYYLWSTGIYGEIQEGKTVSETLNQWLAAGGASLCRQAANRLGLPIR